MKNWLLTFLSVFCLSLVLHAQAQIFEAGDIAYYWVSGNKYDFKVTSHVSDTSKISQIIIYFGDGDSAVCSNNPSAGIFTDTTSHTYPGAGSYNISATLKNRIAGIQNIPISNTTAIGLIATLVINPFLGSGHGSSPNFQYSPLSLGGLSNYSYNSIGSDPDGDSLCYKLTPCQNAPGFTFPATTGIFSLDSLTGYLTWNAPVKTGNYNFCVLVEKWRQGFLIGSVLREIEINIAQKYMPMLDSVNVWSFTPNICITSPPNKISSSCSYPCSSGSFGSYWRNYTTSDSLLNGFLYKKLFTTYNNNSSNCSFGWVREDTAKKQVFFHNKDSIETVLYDFSMKIGDSINIQFCIPDYLKSGYYFLDSIKTISLNSKIRTVFFLNCHKCINSNTLSWVEGIGNLSDFVYTFGRLFRSGCGFLKCSSHFPDYCSQILTCFYHINRVYYDSCTLNEAKSNPGCYFYQDTCDYEASCIGGIDKINPAIIISVYPNPATSTITVRTSETKSYNLELINLLGQITYSHSNVVGQDFTFDVSMLPKGIYVIQLLDLQNGSAGRQKLVIQ